MVVWYHNRLAWWRAIVVVTLLSSASWFGLRHSNNGVVDALSRPHPDWTDFESVHEMRRRLDIAYHYTPEHLDDEQCRYLTEAECRVQDEALADAKVKRNGRHLSPSVGDKIRVLVLLIRFPNHKSRLLPTREYFETMFNGASNDDEVNPVGSIAEYMRFSSLGAYRVQFDVRDWTTAPEAESFYAENKSGLVGVNKLQKMIYPIMNKIDTTAGSIDWLDGYVTDWGILNNVVVIHSGYGAELGPSPCLTHEPPEQRIWSQGTGVSTEGWLSKDYYSINGIAFASAVKPPKCEGDKELPARPANMGVITHEYLHTFGLIDLYDQDGDEKPIPLGGTGRFDIMSNPFGWNQTTSIPGHLSPYSRIKVEGWLDPIVIDRDGFYAIQPSEISGHVYKIDAHFPDGEYLLIENRQPIKWDENFPSRCGIVIYHVDEAAAKQTTRSYPGKAGWPKDHYMVSIEQADGRYDIEKGANPGDESDFWRKGDVLGPGGDFPNTDSIQSGARRATGIKIEIKTDPGFIMSFYVTGINAATQKALAYQQDDPNDDSESHFAPGTVGEALKWIISMLGGAAAMVGMVIVLL